MDSFNQALDFYSNGDFQKAFDIWSGMTNNPEALCNAGVILYNNQLQIPNRWGRAYQLFKSAADLGNKKASYLCGQVLEIAYGEEYYDNAVNYYYDAIIGGQNRAIERVAHLAELGNRSAMSLYSWCLHNGRGIEENPGEAEKWAKKAYEAGAKGSPVFILAWAHRRRKEYAQSFAYFKESANEKDSDSYGPLADHYRLGEGTKQNYTEALKWYKMGADTGHEDARYWLGYMHLMGMGCKKNKEEAIKCFNKVIESGNAIRIRMIGLIYYYGEGGLYDPQYAIRLLELAVSKGDHPAMSDLGILLYQGDNITQDYDRAFSLFNETEELPLSQEYLGLCYYHGHGCKKDTGIARRYFIRALNNGNDNVRKYLTHDMELKPYSKWSLSEQGAEILGGAASFLLGTILSSVGGND